ncbi:bifunctional adenosylcobinamide kinase/adenosylcobinamide-phosphate guanylyltransferase [Robertmurraya korlensis]|uniref:bifunctional adenosylcobinamide kinase/adenosylcobinamide-phosphate guanylyltransferase n=1 Tax=Robertmurraya korlensis TaxID=519977 RepID=UPI001E3F7F11|nr:bifunctional adenosylcobinamide kinase/adenosylcobinamide-phosphate guanylyltransferase [Robertmurraya korlensis]
MTLHFVTGGACNGKANWVRAHYSLCKYPQENWIKAYETSFYDWLSEDPAASLVVVEGIEYWIRELSLQYESGKVRTIWKETLQNWDCWEKDGWKRKVVIIGSDITRGIVPVEKTDRKWRDDAGWTFQDMVQLCDRVDHIWYGIGQRIK